MAQYSQTQLISEARNLAKVHPNNHPLKNPSAMSQYSGPQQQLIGAIAADPVASAVAMASPAAAMAANPGAATPIDGHPIYKSPTTRHNIIGFIGTSVPAGANTGVSATPQNPFAATRMVIGATFIGIAQAGAGTLANIGNWKVGSKSQFASIGQEPIGLFAAGLNGGRLRFTKCPAAIAISATVYTPATATFYACMIGTAGRRKDNGRPPPQYCKEDRIAIPATVLAPGASSTLTVTPTRSFWGTLIVLDDNLTGTYGLAAGTGASNFVLTDLLVGSDSQFMTAPTQGGGIPYVPAGVFNGLHSPPLDLDRAYTSVGITFNFTNVGSVTATFSGVILGDVDKRQDVESDDTDSESAY